MSGNHGDLSDLTRGWSAPPELAGSPPRPVRYSAVGILVMVITAAMLVGGAFLSYKLYQDGTMRTERSRLLHDQGAETEGIVKRLWRGGSKNRQHLIAYEFRADGSVLHGETSVPQSFWESVSEGEHIPIRYVPGNPAVNRPAGAASSEPPVLVVLIVPLIFLGISGFLVHRLRLQRRLLEEGRAAPALVTKSTRTKHGHHIRFDFLMPAGARQSGSGTAKRGSSDVGSRITVVYDPEQPNRAQPYPFELVKVVR